MALALYRKYRPATFAEVVGQEHVTDPLRTALAAGRINHAYLFSGPRGCGKTSSARILARSLNCVHGPTPEPCGECPSCVALAPEGPGSIDVVELDAASHGGVDDTRELRDRAFYMPAESRYRVFIIDEAHMVTPQGFNALLKIVEEPPEHLVFIFATTEPDKVLTTIRSRTHHYPFRLIPPATLRGLLERLCAQEGVSVEPAVFPLVIQAGGGSARDSLSVLDQLLAGAGPEGVTYVHAIALLGVTDAALLDEMVDALAAGDGASVFGAIDKVVEAGHDPRRFAADLLQRLRDLVILGVVPDAAVKGILDAPADQVEKMVEQTERLGSATATRMAEVLHTGLTDMRGTTSPRLVLELLAARMLLPAASLADGALLQRLERLELRSAIAGADPGPGTREGTGSVQAIEGGVASPPVPTRQAPRFERADPSARVDRAGRGGPDASRAGAASSPAASRPADRSAETVGGNPAMPGSSAGRRSGADATAEAGPDLGVPAAPVRHSSSRPKGAPATRSIDSDRRSERLSGATDSAHAASIDEGRGTGTGTGTGTGDATDSGQGEPARGGGRAQEVSARLADEEADNQWVGSTSESSPPAPGRAAQSAGAVDAATESQHPDVAAGELSGSSARPAPATTPGGGDGPDVTDVRRVWPEVLAAVQRKRRTTQILLESATILAVAGGVLQLSMPSPGMARRVTELANAELLRQALREVFGVDWQIRCTAGGSDAGSGAGQTADQWTERAGQRGGGPAGEMPEFGRALGAGATTWDPPPATAAPTADAGPGRGAAGPRSSGTNGVPQEPPDDIPDEYLAEPDPDAPAMVVRDPEELAAELLTAALGARPLSPEV